MKITPAGAQGDGASRKGHPAMDLEREYAATARSKARDARIDAWRRSALAFRSGAMAEGRAELDAIYGHHPRHVYDLFWPKRDTSPAVVLYFHGGFWHRLSKEVFSHFAAGLNALGVPVALASYRLCPEAELANVIGDARQMAVHLHKRLGRPIVVVGHSAGAHLAACLVMTDWKARGFPADVITAGLGISGIYDLRPLLATSLNDILGLDQASAYAASPLLWPVLEERRFHVAVGQEEGEEFRRQSLSLAAVWQACGCHVTLSDLGDVDHLAIADLLSETDSVLTRLVHGLCHET